MSEKDFAPLSAACVRALNDKLYEKRKTAALEIEKMVKDFVAANNTTQIEKLLKILGQDFANSVNPHTRKGGLIGLAAMAIALGKESAAHTEKLVVPVISNFNDADSRVRYYACEALYNVVKVSRGSVLPLFNNIFDALSKLAADPDQNVKNGCELLDRLMKDIVTESSSFDLVAFMPLLRERIYSRNAFVRQFIVSWVLVLDAVPDIDMLIFLPDILDGLFSILGEPTLEIKKSCETVLCEFLRNIVNNPTKVDFPAMVNILIAHSQSSDILLQFTALLWIKEFITLSGRTMLPFTSGILTAVLPSVAYDDEARRSIHETAKAINNHLMQLITVEDDRDSPDGSEHPDAGKELDGVAGQDLSRQTQLDLPTIVDVLTRNLIHNSMQTKVAALKWIYHLHIKIPNKIFRHVEEIFTVLLKTLSDVSDEVVMLDLEVLAEISSSPAGLKFNCKMDIVVPENLVHRSPNMNSYFTKFLVSLLSIFSTDRQLLEDRGSFIVRQLCLLLHAEDIYRTLSEILLHEDDLRFARHMVQTLNTILLTSTELFELRNQLKDLLTEESCSLFSCLYMTWCHSPVAVMSLCLLTQNYEHACDLLQHFADLEITVDLLSEIDKLVQLIESPIFTYLRLQLLDAHQNPHLVKSLYGLLMLLPQSEAFHTLRRRLNCVPNISMMPLEHRPINDRRDKHSDFKPDSSESRLSQKTRLKSINFFKLLSHFQEVQQKHRNANRSMRVHLALDLS